MFGFGKSNIDKDAVLAETQTMLREAHAMLREAHSSFVGLLEIQSRQGREYSAEASMLFGQNRVRPSKRSS